MVELRLHCRMPICLKHLIMLKLEVNVQWPPRKDNPELPQNVDGNYEFDVDVSPKMNNSEWIRNIINKVQHVSVSQRNDIKQLIHEFQDIFPDSPPKTSWIKHDVGVGDVRP